MRRFIFSLAFGATLALGAVGCTESGEYQIRWQFAALPGGSGEPLDAAAVCGAAGVDAIRVTGTGTGDISSTGVCAAREMIRTAPVGTYQFQVHTVDVRGRLIRAADDPDATTEMREITEGGRTEFDVLLTAPRPVCSDTVDNDRDGRVDLDDPDCKGDPAGISEAPAAPQP